MQHLSSIIVQFLSGSTARATIPFRTAVAINSQSTGHTIVASLVVKDRLATIALPDSSWRRTEANRSEPTCQQAKFFFGRTPCCGSNDLAKYFECVLDALYHDDPSVDRQVGQLLLGPVRPMNG